jgi:hypothetical protein
MARKWLTVSLLLFVLAALCGGLATASVETTAPAKQQDAAPADADDETADETSAAKDDDKSDFNTLEDVRLFRGPLATLWAAPVAKTASVEWREVKVDGEKEASTESDDDSEE